MESAEIKKKIHDFVDIADKRILNIFIRIIEAEEQEDNYPAVLSSIYNQIEKELQKHLNVKTDSQTWEEVKERLMQKFNQ
ncbi:hypothetical protein [Chryseobacterium sp. Leaf394]|uniref:hypothetical protein n=1 Tax=Chryseobacterium sp. Leaf394 TaxID=1736361 RepID=UPI0006FFDB7D|nr:hypothetical protein [Chryseobacterium sp. Leaf394]KQS93489.1 hypothetical protein ASG21_00520 [Chryseobacterium sp. Leaf394]